MEKTKIKYPATQLVHCTNGAVNACDMHARQLKGIHKLYGVDTIEAAIEKNKFECSNCINENKKQDNHNE